jgi:hypothetical protein
VIAWIKSHWYFSGTQIAGHVLIYFGLLLSFLEFLTGLPGITFLITPRQFAILTTVVAALGWIVKQRGKTNAQRLKEADDQP